MSFIGEESSLQEGEKAERCRSALAGVREILHQLAAESTSSFVFLVRQDGGKIDGQFFGEVEEIMQLMVAGAGELDRITSDFSKFGG